MTWTFTFEHLADKTGFTENHTDWQAAVSARDRWIDTVHPPKSYHSLKMECENFPIGVSASITDGEFYFKVAKADA